MRIADLIAEFLISRLNIRYHPQGDSLFTYSPSYGYYRETNTLYDIKREGNITHRDLLRVSGGLPIPSSKEIIRCLKERAPLLRVTPGVINFRNGILDLSSNRFRAHSPDIVTTYQLPCYYIPSVRGGRLVEKVMTVLDLDTLNALKSITRSAIISGPVEPMYSLLIVSPYIMGIIEGLWFRWLDRLLPRFVFLPEEIFRGRSGIGWRPFVCTNWVLSLRTERIRRCVMPLAKRITPTSFALITESQSRRAIKPWERLGWRIYDLRRRADIPRWQSIDVDMVKKWEVSAFINYILA